MSNRLRESTKTVHLRSKRGERRETPIAQKVTHQEVDALTARARALLKVSLREAQLLAEAARETSTRVGYTKGLAESNSLLAEVHFRLSDYAAAEPQFLEAIELAKKISDHALHAATRNTFGLMRINQGQYVEAMQLCKESLELAVSINDEKIQAAALTSVGIVYWNLGDYENALDHFLNALALTERAGDRARVAQLLTNIGGVYSQLGDHKSALKFHLECLRLSRELEDLARESNAVNNLTYTYWQLGDALRSSEAQSECLNIKRKLGDRRGEAISLINLADLKEHESHDEEAEELWQTALQILRQIGDKHNEARCLYSMGKFFLKHGAFPKAESILEESLSLAIAVNATPEQTDALFALADVCEQSGNPTKALAYFKRASILEKELLQTKATQKLQNLQVQFQVEQAHRENTRLQQELILKRRSLQVSALAITNKNQTLKSIRQDILHIRQESGQKSREKLISNLLSLIDSKIDAERAWTLFEKELSVLNPDFMKTLAKRFPSLSPQELKICSMLREDIKTKQIALFLNLSPRTVEKHREHIRRAVQLDKEQSLGAFLASI